MGLESTLELMQRFVVGAVIKWKDKENGKCLKDNNELFNF